MFGPRPALIVVAISAGYLYFIIYTAFLMTEAFYIVGILWPLDAAMRLAAALALEPSGLAARPEGSGHNRPLLLGL